MQEKDRFAKAKQSHSLNSLRVSKIISYVNRKTFLEIYKPLGNVF